MPARRRRSLASIPPDELRRRLAAIAAGSAEAETAETTARADGASPRPAGAGRTEALDQYTIDLTERARAGKIDPVLGRDAEIRQVIDILTRRRQNNPILTGEAGVGKTAVVEGFALRIAAGDVPTPLQERRAAHARPGPAAGRRRREGRVREPAEDR